MNRLALCTLIVIVLTSIGAIAQTSSVIVDGNQKARIATFTERSVVYGSMRDVADALDLGIYYAEETKKIELKTSRFRLKATGDNPFVVVNDIASGAESVYHLPVNVIIAGNDLFVPLNDFARFLDIVFPADVTFDQTSRELMVGQLRPDHFVDIRGLEVEERKNGYLIRLKSNRQIKDFSGFYRDDGWFYLTVVGAHVDMDAFKNFRPKTPIRRVVPEQTPTAFQLSLQLNREIHSTDIFRDPQSNDIIIALHRRIDPSELAQEHGRPTPADMFARDRDRWKFDVIVIDPGHGGKRAPGAVGRRGTLEKDVALAISKKLGDMIKQNLPGIEVVYTREKDEHVDLWRRGQIANEAGGKLFISIHANSVDRNPSPRGFEIYLLGPGRTEEAIRIAERENAVIRYEEDHAERYAHLTDENFILVSMAHRAYIQYSEHFAGILQEKMTKYSSVVNRGVRQAGFIVLVGPSMPSILFETGYLSHPEEERFLASPQGQEQIARALFNAIKRYSEEYEQIVGTFP